MCLLYEYDVRLGAVHSEEELGVSFRDVQGSQGSPCALSEMTLIGSLLAVVDL